jgi:hypothetical protein
MVFGQKIIWEKKPSEIWQVLYRGQLVSEREVAVDDLEVFEALAPHDHSLQLLNQEIHTG